MAVDNAIRVDMLKTMLRMVIFEEHLLRLFEQGKISGFYHAGRGQEAVQAAAIATLRPDDYLLYAHRGVGYLVARGVPPSKLYGDFLGTTEGTVRGKGAGIVHIAWPQLGVLGQSGTLGGCFPIAAGAGLSIKLRGSDQVVLCFFGEGTGNRGTFHEAMNFAALHKLPVVFLCENNGYAVSVPVEQSTAGKIADRAIGYGIPGQRINGMDPDETYTAVLGAVQRARAGEGPTLIEALCYRYRGHFEGDPDTYRSKEERQAWLERDPIQTYSARLKSEGLVTDEQIASWQAEFQQEMQAAAAIAEAAPLPDRSRIYEDLFAEV